MDAVGSTEGISEGPAEGFDEVVGDIDITFDGRKDGSAETNVVGLDDGDVVTTGTDGPVKTIDRSAMPVE